MVELRTIGRFRLEAEAGSGAAGTVYRAVDPNTDAHVALKLVRGVADLDAARFAREVAILGRIQHPGVVRFVDHGRTEEGHAYLVMEWLEGEDLRRRLARAPITLGECLALGQRVASALAAIHDQRLLHRDIKPGNIFLPAGLAGDAKLIDFGLVRQEHNSIELTRTGNIVGTPSYMSPEQARGQREIDARADVFSLGCVLYKCIAGRPPFEGDSILAVLTKVLLEEPLPLCALRPTVPLELDQLICRMLQKEPDRRPSSAAEVARALAAIHLPDEDDPDMEPAPASGLFAGLTSEERRVMSVLLAGVPGPSSMEATLPDGFAPAPEVRVDALVEAHGCRLEALLDGTRVITMPAKGPAIDQAAAVARCALALLSAAPSTTMAIATGRGEVGRRRPTGEAIERAAALLSDRTMAMEEAIAEGAPLPPPIAVDEVTAALLDARFEVEEGCDGRSLAGERAAEAPGRTLMGRAMPMIGREWEIGSMEAIFRDAVEERAARAMLVTGGPGMGKSRLAHELVRHLRAQAPGLEVWWGRSDPMRTGSPLSLLGQVVRDASGVQPTDPLEPRRRRLAERVAARVAGAEALWVAELLGEIADVPFLDDASPALRAARRDPRVLSDELGAAWEALVDGASAIGPLVVVLEDLQWADPATIRVIGQSMERLEHRPWLVVALARPEVHDAFPRLWEGRALQEIRLKPLTRRAGERLTREALGERATPETIERIAARFEGNAFYLEELIRAVADGHEELPDTVLGMVQARLSSLDAGTRRALRAASIFGERFCESGAVALLGAAAPQPSWVAALVEREIVTARGGATFAGERELAFRHTLLHEGAYATLTEVDRVLGHRLAAEWLEQHGETDPLVLAHHYEIALDEARASRSYRAAALRALRAGDADAGISRAERALALAPSDPQRIACLHTLVEARAWRDDWAGASLDADHLLRLSKPGTAAWIQAMATRQSAALHLDRSEDLRSALPALATVEPAAEALRALVPALAISVLVLALAGQLDAAATVLARLETLLRDDAAGVGAAGATATAATQAAKPIGLASLSLARSSVAAWHRGDARAALEHARLARAQAEGDHDAHYARFARIFVGTSLWDLGASAGAEEELRAVSAGEGDDLVASLASFFLAALLIERGDLAEATSLAELRLARSRSRKAGQGALREAEARWLLGEIALRRGDLEAAERDLAWSVDAISGASILWPVAAARLTEVLRARGKTEMAADLERDLASARATSSGPGLRVLTLRGLGDLEQPLD